MTGAWPPPVVDSTVWSDLPIRVREFPPAFERVKVRSVLLWGQVVKVNEAGEVWCPACRKFRAVEQLGRADNACPVGRPATGGIEWISEEEMLEESRKAPPGSLSDSLARLLR